MKQKIAAMRTSELVRQSGTNLIALGLSTVAGILALVVAGDAAFTHYAQAIAATSLLTLVMSQRLEVLLLTSGPGARPSIIHLITRSTLIVGAAGAIAAIAIFVTTGATLRASTILPIVPLAALLVATEVLTAARSADGNLRAVRLSRIVTGITLAIALPIAGTIWGTGVSLLIADLVARSAGLIAIRSGSATQQQLTPETGRESGQSVELSSFRRNYLPASAISAVSIAIVPLVSPALFKPAAIAAYLVVFRVASALAGSIGRAVALMSPVTLTADRSTTTLEREYRNGTRRGLAMGLLFVGGGIALVLVEQLAGYGTAALSIAPWLFAVGIAQVSAAHLLARQRYHWTLAVSIIDVVLTCIGLAIGWRTDSLAFGLGCYSVGAAGVAVLVARRERSADSPIA